ncbi:hypothetical protein C1H46_027390 [Malus baccata]|uniref:Uncharacterized protein n=1 Tax=Malus baccata TaxID=106549 RepID=A0A540LLB5_MALBA|nr:hypothetical protein C1H46_027390 [Malus baccata]
MRLVKLDELRQEAKFEAKANRMLMLKAYRQRMATLKERTSQTLLRKMAWEKKYKERGRAAISQKHAAAKKKGSYGLAEDTLRTGGSGHPKEVSPNELYSQSTIYIAAAHALKPNYYATIDWTNPRAASKEENVRGIVEKKIHDRFKTWRAKLYKLYYVPFENFEQRKHCDDPRNMMEVKAMLAHVGINIGSFGVGTLQSTSTQQQGCGSSHAHISTLFEGGNDKNVQCGPPVSSAMMHEDCQSENTG